ncbi:Uncharacterised protein [Salmonella enterica subsp. enterica]|nr:Uncharacterised protein [Salmonella enterica subsp. enterica]
MLIFYFTRNNAIKVSYKIIYSTRSVKLTIQTGF